MTKTMDLALVAAGVAIIAYLNKDAIKKVFNMNYYVNDLHLGTNRYFYQVPKKSLY